MSGSKIGSFPIPVALKGKSLTITLSFPTPTTPAVTMAEGKVTDVFSSMTDEKLGVLGTPEVIFNAGIIALGALGTNKLTTGAWFGGSDKNFLFGQ